jgi:hypothetical protein
MKSATPAVLSVAEMCLLEPALFKAGPATSPPVCELLQWPVLDLIQAPAWLDRGAE